MSIRTEIDRISASVTAAYSVMEGMGASMPSDRNVDNLAATAATIPTGSSKTQLSITLSANGWVDNQQSVTVVGATADCLVFTGPDVESGQEYADCEVWCAGQGDGTLTFSCTYIPAENLLVNVAMFV